MNTNIKINTAGKLLVLVAVLGTMGGCASVDKGFYDQTRLAKGSGKNGDVMIGLVTGLTVVPAQSICDAAAKKYPGFHDDRCLHAADYYGQTPVTRNLWTVDSFSTLVPNDVQRPENTFLIANEGLAKATIKPDSPIPYFQEYIKQSDDCYFTTHPAITSNGLICPKYGFSYKDIE